MGGSADAQGLTGQEKQILPLIKASWVAFRLYSGRQFIYFSNVLAYRCGLSELRYSINSDALDQRFPLPPCDPTNPQALDAVKYPPFVTLAPGTAKQVAVQAIFKDGSRGGHLKVFATGLADTRDALPSYTPAFGATKLEVTGLSIDGTKIYIAGTATVGSASQVFVSCIDTVNVSSLFC